MSTIAAAPAATTFASSDRRVGGFLVLTFALSWGSWLIALLLGGDLSSPAVFAFYAIGGFGPSLAAVVYRLRGVRSPRVPRPGRLALWLPAAIGLGAAPAVLAATLGPLVGAPALGIADITASFADSGLLPFLLIATMAGPLSEEFGWRGYVQPRLRARLSPLATAGVLGTIWALWHVPLFLLTGTSQSSLGAVEAVGFLACMVPMSLTYWFISERLRGGVPAAVVMHYAGNVSLSLLPFTALTGGLIFAATVLVTAGVLVAVPAVGARTSRRALGAERSGTQVGAAVTGTGRRSRGV
ncbi:type II CAAX endopeptidase family protein [Occultella gossypii]|uniref:CPBP family intramembrane metalloprotease n=1 Tax=Occultella gossypii TaxID=2800820 RepID=A0ABS7SAH6_9MICO|nr:type II CAAX endopeptidase family protein [Occultella gossypii]MBZ2197195.1 CPBP family intramembrane metalloprotease [Occultella gossypii]